MPSHLPRPEAPRRRPTTAGGGARPTRPTTPACGGRRTTPGCGGRRTTPEIPWSRPPPRPTTPTATTGPRRTRRRRTTPTATTWPTADTAETNDTYGYTWPTADTAETNDTSGYTWPTADTAETNDTSGYTWPTADTAETNDTYGYTWPTADTAETNDTYGYYWPTADTAETNDTYGYYWPTADTAETNDTYGYYWPTADTADTYGYYWPTADTADTYDTYGYYWPTADTYDTGWPGPLPVEHCATYYGDAFTMQGYDFDWFGVAAWNSVGGAEPAATGHSLGVIHPAMTSIPAYYYMATRDHVDPGAQGGARLGNMVSMPNTAAALLAHGFPVEEIVFQQSMLSLGADVQGQDWMWNPPVETRYYTGAGEVSLWLGGELLVRGSLGRSTVFIDYGPNPLDTSDHQLSGHSDPVFFFDASFGSSPQAQDVARALLEDLYWSTGVVFSMSSLQNATQGDFSGSGRSGGYFDISMASVTPICPLD